MSAEDVPQPLVSSDTQQNPHPFSPIIESTVPAASGEREGNPFAALQGYQL